MNLQRRLILASKSPRRIGLLRQIGLSPEVIPSDVPEDFDLSLSAQANANALALRKAQDTGKAVDDGIIVGADTIVVVNGTMLAKPVDAADARRMLRQLSGRAHVVHTGFALLDRPSGYAVTAVESTTVVFRELPDEEIAGYVEGGSPMDKAGAYGIQDDYGAVFVTRIEGCFYNVVGFPLSRFYTTLQKFLETWTRTRFSD